MNVGLIGWQAHTGLGYVNLDLWHTGRFAKWIRVAHPKLGVSDTMLPEADERRLPIVPFSSDALELQLKGLDALVMIEQPYRSDPGPLMAKCAELGVTTVVVPMLEWFPTVQSKAWGQWASKVDVLFAPTRHTLDELTKQAADAGSKTAAVGGTKPARWRPFIRGGAWGILHEAAAPHVRQRQVAESFLFCNGWGGAHSRKGLGVLMSAARRCPKVPIIIRSQAPLNGAGDVPKNVEVIVGDVADRWSLYDRGDVLVAPSRFEGLGLHLYEAQAVGMPVLTTAAPPMNETGPVKLIACTKASVVIEGRKVVANDCDVRSLANSLSFLYGRNISDGSKLAIDHVAQNANLRTIVAEALFPAIAERRDAAAVGDAESVAAE